MMHTPPPPFDDATVKMRFESFARGMCECDGCAGHKGHCLVTFAFSHRGTADDDTAWEAQHFDLGGDASLANCRIICVRCMNLNPNSGKHRQPGGAAPPPRG